MILNIIAVGLRRRRHNARTRVAQPSRSPYGASQGRYPSRYRSGNRESCAGDCRHTGGVRYLGIDPDATATRITRTKTARLAEALAGIPMISGALSWISIPVALFMASIGAVSVFKAVYIDKRELKCACVGGDSNVPLDFIAEPPSLASQHPQPFAHRRVVVLHRPIAHARAIRADDCASPPLAHPQRRLKMRDRFPLGSRAYHFFASRSFIPALSTTAHASASFRMPIICSSENCFRFILPSGRTLPSTGGENRSQVKSCPNSSRCGCAITNA